MRLDESQLTKNDLDNLRRAALQMIENAPENVIDAAQLVELFPGKFIIMEDQLENFVLAQDEQGERAVWTLCVSARCHRTGAHAFIESRQSDYLVDRNAVFGRSAVG